MSQKNPLKNLENMDTISAQDNSHAKSGARAWVSSGVTCCVTLATYQIVISVVLQEGSAEQLCMQGQH